MGVKIDVIRKNAPKHANKFIYHNNGVITYLKVNDWFQYWYEGKWHDCSNTQYVFFTKDMIGIYPL